MQRLTMKKEGVIELVLSIVLFKEGDYSVVYCPALELSSYASDKQAALKEFEVELKIFFEETLKLLKITLHLKIIQRICTTAISSKMTENNEQ